MGSIFKDCGDNSEVCLLCLQEALSFVLEALLKQPSAEMLICNSNATEAEVERCLESTVLQA